MSYHSPWCAPQEIFPQMHFIHSLTMKDLGTCIIYSGHMNWTTFSKQDTLWFHNNCKVSKPDLKYNIPQLDMQNQTLVILNPWARILDPGLSHVFVILINVKIKVSPGLVLD